MPDPADKGRPSSAPLSVEDADRLADSFTPFWEDSGAPVASGGEPAPTPNPGAVTAPMPAVEAARKPLGKQTLLGIAPLVIERPPSTPQATPIPPAIAPTQPLPATAPVAAPAAAPAIAAPAVAAPAGAVAKPATAAPEQPTEPAATAATPHKQTLLGYSDPATGASVPTPIARASLAPAAIQQSAPSVTGYAIAYTPKDPPSTPAVVIAPEAQSSPENLPPENKRQFSQTVPSRIRSAPNASVAPLPPPPTLEDFNPYAPKKGKGKAIGLGLGGALLLLGAALGVRALSGSSREPAAQSAPRNDVVPAATAVAAAPTLVPAKPAETAEPTSTPAPASPAASEPAPAALAVRRASEPAPAKVRAKARPVTRAPAAEPSPQPTRPASKGIIVRDAPF